MGRRVGWAVLLATWWVASVASAQPREEFAIHLMRERDYFRAITVYKELALFESDPWIRSRHRYKIGLAYRLSRHYELSQQALVPLLSDPAAEPMLGQVHLQVALAHVGMHSPGAAAYHLEAAERLGQAHLARIISSWIQLESGDAAGAKSQLAPLARAQPPAPVLAMSRRLSAASDQLDQPPSKSPGLAALMSAVVPGSGQVYTGHHTDGAQAFGFVGAFGFATYLAYQHDRDRGNPYLLTALAGSITAFLHLSNILGAERTARFHNERRKQLLLLPLRRDILEMTF
jgi:hypothetical protein